MASFAFDESIALSFKLALWEELEICVLTRPWDKDWIATIANFLLYNNCVISKDEVIMNVGFGSVLVSKAYLDPEPSCWEHPNIVSDAEHATAICDREDNSM